MNRFLKILLTIAFGILLSASAINDARKANEAYRSGNYEAAVNLYRSAISQNPDDARLYYNLGNALSRLGLTEEAMEAYEQFKNRADDPGKQSMADYNTGTMLSEAEQYEEAMEHFRNALIRNPHDEDARYNYEMALRRMMQQQEQQQQQQDQDQSQGDDDQDQQDQDQSEQNQNQDEQDQDSGPPQPQDQDAGDRELPQPGELTQEEAENILNALEQLERDILENRKKESTETTTNEKDW